MYCSKVYLYIHVYVYSVTPEYQAILHHPTTPTLIHLYSKNLAEQAESSLDAHSVFTGLRSRRLQRILLRRRSFGTGGGVPLCTLVWNQREIDCQLRYVIG